MTNSQIALTAFIVIIIWRTIIAFRKKNLSSSFLVVWILFWVTVIGLIFEQRLVINLANKLGISRGVDLIIYVSLVVIYYFIYRFLGNIYELDQKITKIVREIAIKNAKTKKT